jgi:adenosylcobyric acid synthase
MGQALGEELAGYEMHMGVTTGPACARPFALLDGGQGDGAISGDGLVMGTYCHGFLGSTGLRRALLARIGAGSTGADYAASVDAALDELAEALERHLDIDALLALARER